MKIGIAADHGGFTLKEKVSDFLKSRQHEVKDFGALSYDAADDYPDFVIPLSNALASNTIDRAIAICGSGVGACIAANKINGVRAALINDLFSAHQGVEDDDMNLICLGGRVVDENEALKFIEAFLQASFTGEERHKRRLAKVNALEKK
jgi:ribose 5-phosphate isomerase B